MLVEELPPNLCLAQFYSWPERFKEGEERILQTRIIRNKVNTKHMYPIM